MNVRFQIKTDQRQRLEPQIETGKALVYVVEDQRFKAVQDVTARIGLDGTWVGATRGNSFILHGGTGRAPLMRGLDVGPGNRD